MLVTCQLYHLQYILYDLAGRLNYGYGLCHIINPMPIRSKVFYKSNITGLNDVNQCIVTSHNNEMNNSNIR